jgi:hypothetical protein
MAANAVAWSTHRLVATTNRLVATTHTTTQRLLATTHTTTHWLVARLSPSPQPAAAAAAAAAAASVRLYLAHCMQLLSSLTCTRLSLKSREKKQDE